MLATLLGNSSWFVGAQAPTITFPTSLPSGTVGTVYTTTQFLATGSPTITWSITSGTLPTGLTFSSSGLLSGTPTATSSVSITFTATNGVGSANLPLSLTVGSSTVVANTMLLSLPTGTATSYPYQFGRVFKQGVIANYPQVLIDGVAQTTQADVKNRWPDGSVKFAIISLIVPSLSTTAKTFTFQNQATVNNTPETKANMLASYDFNCTINATSGGSAITGAPVAARTILNALSDATLASNTSSDSPNSRYWTQGPICTTVILCDHTSKTYDFGTRASAKSLRPIFHVQFWPTLSKYKVRVIVEGSDTTKLEDQAYDLSLSTGNASPTTVYTQSAIPQSLATRWTKSFWSGTAPVSINANHNANYLSHVPVMPYYDPTSAPTETDIQNYVTAFNTATTNLYDPGAVGAGVGWTKYMQAPGGRPEIALIAEWDVQSILSGDYRLSNISTTLSELSMAWPMHFREGLNTKYYNAAQNSLAIGLPVSLFARPSMMMGDQNGYMTGYQYGSYFINAEDRYIWASGVDVTTGASVTNNNGWAPFDDHAPAPGYLQYLTTGEYVWLEQIQFWASWSAFDAQNTTTSGFYSRGPTTTNAALPGDTRRQAWILKNRVAAAAFSVDNSLQKTYFDYLMTDAIAIAEGIRGVTGGAGQGSASYVWGQTIGRNGGPPYYDGMYGKSLGLPPIRLWDVNESGCSSFAAIYQSQWNTSVSLAQGPWQTYAYMALALAFSKDLGYSTDGLMNWIAYSINDATSSDQNGWLMGNFVIPMANTTPSSWIPNFNTVFSYYIDPTYPKNYVLNSLNSTDYPCTSVAAGTAYMYTAVNVTSSWNWINTNWVSARNPSYPIPSRWRILPRP